MRTDNLDKGHHMTIKSYPSIYGIGHRLTKELFDDSVVVQEKIDGSQISAKVDENGELLMRSKGVQLNVDAPDKMFAKAVEYMKSVKDKMTPGWEYRGEYLQKPKHNTLKYDRVPKNNIALFDIDKGDQDYVYHAEIPFYAKQLELDSVPVYYEGKTTLADVKHYLELDSYLGGAKVEGIVVKSYTKFNPDKKSLFGKLVSEDFKEAHKVQWKAGNPNASDIVFSIIEALKTDARWEKAVQHLRDNGRLTVSAKDIGPLLIEVKEDIQKECEDQIKDELYKWAKDKILRGCTAGVPEWYKARLLNDQT